MPVNRSGNCAKRENIHIECSINASACAGWLCVCVVYARWWSSCSSGGGGGNGMRITYTRIYVYTRIKGAGAKTLRSAYLRSYINDPNRAHAGTNVCPSCEHRHTHTYWMRTTAPPRRLLRVVRLSSLSSRRVLSGPEEEERWMCPGGVGEGWRNGGGHDR